MSDYIKYILIFHFVFINIISLLLTVADKMRAKNRKKRRVPEKTLLMASALGGSVIMYITMVIIRHKTMHIKFMAGIPIIIVIQIIAVCLVIRFL